EGARPYVYGESCSHALQYRRHAPRSTGCRRRALAPARGALYAAGAGGLGGRGVGFVFDVIGFCSLRVKPSSSWLRPPGDSPAARGLFIGSAVWIAQGRPARRLAQGAEELLGVGVGRPNFTPAAGAASLGGGCALL